MLSATVVNLLHLVATAFWIGGMLFMKLVLLPAQQAIDPPQRGRLMGAVAPRFTAGVWISVLLLLVTGFVRTPSGRFLDFGSTFGIALAVKHLLIAAMIAVGLVITLAVAPRLRALAPAPGSAPEEAFVHAQRRLDVLSAVNTVLGLLVLVCVAVMQG